ncbi:MAG TPA: hypothetical protein VED46_09780 [Alphaproteobacteria bacterium]|nr:hypothetical protein [Alphaproteobacteria bacterium]
MDSKKPWTAVAQQISASEESDHDQRGDQRALDAGAAPVTGMA